MKIISLEGDYLHGKIKSPQGEYDIVVLSIGNGKAEIRIEPPLPNMEIPILDVCKTDSRDFFNEIQNTINKHIPQSTLESAYEGYIIKTDEFDDARYMLDINKKDGKATLIPYFLSFETLSQGCPVTDLFNDMHDKLLPQFEQYYNEHKCSIGQGMSEEILMNRLEKLLRSNNRL